MTVQSGQTGDIYLFTVPENQLEHLRTYGYSFWIRPSYSGPVPFNWGLYHGAWGGIAGATENPQGNFNGGGVGDRCLAMWHANGAHAPVRGHPAFHTSSY